MDVFSSLQLLALALFGYALYGIIHRLFLSSMLAQARGSPIGGPGQKVFYCLVHDRQYHGIDNWQVN